MNTFIEKYKTFNFIYGRGKNEEKPVMKIYRSVKKMSFPGDSVVKNLPAKAGDIDLILGSGRSPEEGNHSLLQLSYLGNPMDRGAWLASVNRVQKELDMT